MSIVLQPNIPIDIEPGIYIASTIHWGWSHISFVGFFVVNRFKGSEADGHINKFFRCNNILLNGTEDNVIQYNPYTCQIKIDPTDKSDHMFLLVKINVA